MHPEAIAVSAINALRKREDSQKGKLLLIRSIDSV